VKNAFRVFLSYLLCDWVATAGAILVTTTAVVFLIYAFESFTNPYYGILVFLILPGLFMLGLLLIPLGVWRSSRRLGGVANIPQVEVSGTRAMRLFGLVAVLTIVNVTIISAASYKSVKYMDSNQFCGTTCHTVMSPQYTAYQDSPHSRVDCVSCHIGPGADWFVQYKLSGLWQVFAVTFNTFHRPLPAAIKSLRPSQDTCEQCHWPQKFISDKLRVIKRYDEDEKNSEKITVLMMHIGTRIHKAHVGRNIEYIATDPARQVIPWVSVDGVEYKTGDATGERRRMDCIDCHNRPTHAFETPAPAVDKALESGELDRSIPYVKRDALLWLSGKKSIADAPAAVKRIHARNIWPKMEINWGSYPNNIGHDAFPGCFRCHDDNHKSAAGKTITQDCATCHEMLAVGEENPEILRQLGISSASSKILR
jgi:hypothetical protein